MQERPDLSLACEASEPVQSEVSIETLQIGYFMSGRRMRHAR
jgi:hypothetical protein